MRKKVDSVEREQVNCKNCGAPLDEKGKCQYCGSVLIGEHPRSYLEVTADCIRIGWLPEIRKK